MESTDVLDFWLGPLDAHGIADPEHSRRWWTRDPALDALIEARFGAEHAAVARGERETWLGSPRGRLAYVIVLDQFSRNLFRNRAQAFATDAQALRASLGGIERGDDRALGCDERVFLYMPLMHCETLAHQDTCLALFRALRDAAPAAASERFAGFLDYAERHRNVIARFGRFPHRNAVLGRDSTGQELAFLEGPGSSF